KDHIPKIAIIIDDIGYDKKIALALCDLNSKITFSILPFAPFGKYVSEKLHEKGSQLMLHLPMEPVEYPDIDPGPGAILSIMPPDVLIDQLKKNIKAVPNIAGVNNHMGSKLTSHSDQMNQIFTILKKENLFFVDSRTSAESQCEASARLLNLKFARRNVFLDNFQNTKYIAEQLKKLVALAKKHGSAIGIGHPYKETLEALSKELPKLKNEVEIVRASVLTAVPG
ncbi:MAG: divergent polysaccharide deacetylase family protein, partial [Desulfobacteraceae bacterium]|nr:divergent polysaccharide deacetylase family protein [Desulfobacteraceae bacterium]